MGSDLRDGMRRRCHACIGEMYVSVSVVCECLYEHMESESPTSDAKERLRPIRIIIAVAAYYDTTKKITVTTK